MKNNFSEFGGNPERITPSKAELGYLAGIVDGEGSICMISPFYHEKFKKSYLAGITIVNSSMPLLIKCQAILSQIVGGQVNILRKIAKTNLDMYTIEIRKKVYIFEVLTAIEPYMTAKRNKAISVLRVLTARGIYLKNNRYTKEFWDFWKREWSANFARVETEREAPVTGEATVRASWEHEESGRNA